MQTEPIIGLVNFFVTLLIAGMIGGAVGYASSYIILRLDQEWFLALVLLVGGEIVRVVVRSVDPIVCSSNGVSGIAQPFAFIDDPRVASVAFALFTLALAGIVFVYCERLTHSPFGRLLKAMRENERITQAMGKNTARARAKVMFIGSSIAAIAGVLFAANIGFVSANDYVVTLTLDVWVMATLGGLGNNKGVALGALIITVLDRATAISAIQMNMSGVDLEFNYMRFILFGLILLLTLRFRPQGLIPESAPTTEAHIILRDTA